jgi:cytochrome c peroxidase
VLDEGDPLFIGGNFWDGRATGERLGSPAAEQAQGPFLNPAEQALPAASAVVARICESTAYGDLFRQVAGSQACDPANVAQAYDQVGYAIAAYEASAESNAFTSKFDHYLKGAVKLTQLEQQGLNLFNGKGKCSAHVAGRQVQALGAGGRHDVRGVAGQEQAAEAHRLGDEAAQRRDALLDRRAGDQRSAASAAAAAQLVPEGSSDQSSTLSSASTARSSGCACGCACEHSAKPRSWLA